MSLKQLSLFVLSLLFLAACSRDVEVKDYVEVVKLPRQSRPQMAAPPADPMRAGPLTVDPVPENLPPGHPTFDGMHPPVTGGAGPNAMAGRESEVPPAPKVEGLSWALPPGWKEQPGSGMRIVQFLPEPDTPAALVTLIALSGQAGSMEANISRWRGQVQLDPSKPVEIQHIDGKLHFEFVTFVKESKDLGLPQSTVAAMYQLPQRTLFLKFMGPTEIVENHKFDFLQLAGSLSIGEESP